jgi:CRISPR/Cas system CSM-associated protein Csm2 small subunit
MNENQGSRRKRPKQGLQEEISMLRSVIRRIVSMSDGGRELPELLRIVETLGKTSTRLATLLKADRQLETREDVSSALDEVLEEMIREIRQGSAN